MAKKTIIFICKGCDKKNEIVGSFSRVTSYDCDCGYHFTTSGVKLLGINTNPWSRTTKVEFGETTVAGGIDRLNKQ